MKFTIEIDEMKRGIVALATALKKLPNDYDDTPVIGIVREEGEYVMAVCQEEFAATVPLRTFITIGDDSDVPAHKSGETLGASSVISISGFNELIKIIKKLKKGDAVEFDYKPVSHSSSAKELHLRVGNGKYTFSCSDSRKFCSLYSQLSKCSDTIMAIDPSSLTMFYDSVSNVASVLSPSISNPAYGCVCLSSEEVDMGMRCRISGTSNVDGYTLVYDTDIVAVKPFNALFTKQMGSALKSFADQFTPSEESCVKASYVDDVTIRKMSVSNEMYTLYIQCTGYQFPFASLRKLIARIKGSSVIVSMSHKDFSEALGKVSTFSVGESPVLTLSVFQGGTVKIASVESGYSKKTNAEDMIEGCSVLEFPDDAHEHSIKVDAKMLVQLSKMNPSDECVIFISPGTNTTSGMAAIGDSSASNEQYLGVLIGRR